MNLKAVQNNDYELTGITLVSQENFDKHTESMKNGQTSNKQGAAQENSSVHKVSGASSAVEHNGNDLNGSTNASSEGDSNYVDTSLNAYLNYGVSYDKANKQWIFDNKPIHYLNDGDNATFVDNRNHATKNGISLKVIRKSNGEIDKVVKNIWLRNIDL